jgi:tRNA A-37 threonylcarbamoyl transferase component Bud32/tetratricopeptide (TPR) repeat protein
MVSDQAEDDTRLGGAYGSGESSDADIEAMVGRTLADRFEINAVLGAGAHGAVYEARDRRHDRIVALKTLLQLGPDRLVRFKREFRELSDIGHPNLVTLHELFVGDEGAFFTMELVDGTDFLSWVRTDELDELDEDRLRDAVRQLAQGLVALHAHGLLHRDLKPSNVLVDRTGHVRLADFGLARPVDGAAARGELVGTPAYMSPEQAASRSIDASSDWYSVGVMLYEALTGTYPYAGLHGMALLVAKQGRSHEPPSAIDPDVPEDLDALCRDLLERDPSARPTGEEVLARLGAEPELAPPGSREVALVGRDDELARLHAALQRASAGETIVVLLHGKSGSGKSMLLAQFVAETDRAVVLRGRCFERESVPYKGLDVLVDALREHLLSRDAAATALDLPGGGALARLFPVLHDVPGVIAAPRAAAEDPVEQRRQAIAALRELLRRVTMSRPLVLWLDDLQWCDHDTASLLVELLRPIDRPPLLVIGSHRSEDAQGSVLSELREDLRALPRLVLDEVALGPLSPHDSRALAELMLGPHRDRTAIAAAIAREAEGSPLFVAELCRYVLGGHALSGGRALDSVVRHRAARLPEDAQRLLELVAIAAGPTSQGVVLAAADAHERGPVALGLLRSWSFVRTHGADTDDLVEPFHDRIREAIVAGLEPARVRSCHARLAQQLEQRDADPELLAAHLHGAGESARASGYLTAAARRAADALAFNRAARLFERALELMPASDPDRVRALQGMGEALAHLGRGRAAADAYLAAAAEAPRRDVARLQRLATAELLRSGHIEEGVSSLRRVLSTVGLFSPSSPQQAAVALVGLRVRIAARGTDFDERREADVDPQLLEKIDATWAAAAGLQQSNVLMGQYFQARHLLLALEGGEPRRVARALGMETLYAATAGSHGQVQTDALLEQVEGLSHRLDDPLSYAVAALASGVAELYRGRFTRARPRLEEAERVLRERCSNVQWEMAMVRTFLVLSLYYLGDFPAMSRMMEACLRDAAERDDLHTQLMLRAAFEPILHLFAGDLAEARRAHDALERAHAGPLGTATYRYTLVLTQSRIERFAGRGRASWDPFDRHGAAVRRSLMLTKQPFRIFMAHDRALAAVLVARDEGGRRFLAVAKKQASLLVKERTRWSRAMATPIEASLSAAAGDLAGALSALERGERWFVESGMEVYAACVRRRRGELLGASTGAELVADADAVMRARDVADPARLTDMFTSPVTGWRRHDR